MNCSVSRQHSPKIKTHGVGVLAFLFLVLIGLWFANCQGKGMPPKKVEEKERDGEKCGQCKSRVGEDGIQCEICNVWSHPKCVGISKEGYEFLSSNTQIHWFYASCNVGVGNLINEVNRLKDSIGKQAEKIEAVCDRVDKVYGGMVEIQGAQRKIEDDFGKVINQVDELKSQIQSIGNKNLEIENKIEVKELTKAFLKDELWSDVVKKEVANNLEDMKVYISEIERAAVETKTRVEDTQDKEARRKNVIIYRAVESDTQLFADRLKHDTKLMMELMEYVTDLDSDNVSISKIMRLGKKNLINVDPF